MSKFSKGDTVVLTENAGGFWENKVTKGTVGVVVDTGWGCAKVKFEGENDIVEVKENQLR